MFSTSGDILNIVLAVSIAVFTGFLCWMLSVITRTLKRVFSVIDDVHSLIESIKDKVDRTEAMFKTVEEKVKSFSAFLPLLASGLGKIIEYLKNRNSSKKRSAKRATE